MTTLFSIVARSRHNGSKSVVRERDGRFYLANPFGGAVSPAHLDASQVGLAMAAITASFADNVDGVDFYVYNVAEGNNHIQDMFDSLDPDGHEKRHPRCEEPHFYRENKCLCDKYEHLRTF